MGDHERQRLQAPAALRDPFTGNAEPAAEIDMRDRVASGAQGQDEFGQNPERGLHPGKIGDLAADYACRRR
jgi:hypothetical protein